MALARPSGCRCCQPCSRCINVLPYVPVKERVVDTRSNEKRKRGGSQRHRRQSKLAVGEDRLVFRFWYRHNIHNTERRKEGSIGHVPVSDRLSIRYASLVIRFTIFTFISKGTLDLSVTVITIYMDATI